MRELDIPKKENLMLVLLALMAGIIFNYLFYEKIPGVSYSLYVVLFLGLFWWNSRGSLTRKSVFGWFITVPIVLLAVTFARYSNPVLEVLNSLLVPVLVVAHSILVTEEESVWSRITFVADLFKRAVLFPIENIPKPFLIIAKELKREEPGAAHTNGKKIALGLILSLPILLIVVPLLSSADMVFHHYLSNLTKIGRLFDFKSTLNQGVIIFFVFIYTCGYLGSFKVSYPQSDTGTILQRFVWDPVTLLTVLSVINCVYLLFSLVQFSYLYGGESHLLPAAFTYAEYARRGFWELLAVTILNLTVLLGSMAYVNKENRTLYIAVRSLLTILVLFSLNMLFSAHFKMSLYEQAYGLTYLRVFVHYFMGLVLVLFIVALANIWLGKPPLIKTYIIITLVFYTVLNYANVDLIIAKNNIERYHQTGKLDVYYFHNLSYDAVPEAAKLLGDPNTKIEELVRDYMLLKKPDLSKHTHWQSFNWSRYKAGLVLNND